MLSHPQLMTRIEQYSFDDPNQPRPNFGFLDRLCVETGWSKPFARGAIAEYRRFLYLAATGGQPVTPSREVDAVWHLHLTYTRSYWERLRAILPRDLHHEPTPGGRDAARGYRSQYAQTKARYKAEFGEIPPDDYWPPEAERFQADMRKMRGLEGERSRLGVGWAVGGAIAAVIAAAPAFAADGIAGNAVGLMAIGAGVFLVLLALISFGSASGPAKGGGRRDRGGDGGVYSGGGCGTSGGKGGGKGEGGEGGESGGESGGEGGSDGGGDGGGGGCGGGCGS